MYGRSRSEKRTILKNRTRKKNLSKTREWLALCLNETLCDGFCPHTAILINTRKNLTEVLVTVPPYL
jgi:hypothetical protein